MADRKKTPDDQDLPDLPEEAGQGDMKKISKVDLSLHGDGVSHWQDEPQGGKKKTADERGSKKGR